ncbi:MAG: sulfur oxidation c-type cytochrome SoxX [Betaproteobacteria bacterium]|nr:sulfur oxidation c-type cytochrome SoxX [Betaproteobacteria bacterium]
MKPAAVAALGLALAAPALVLPPPAAAADPERGKALAVNRQKGFCLLCHAAPIPEERFQGDIGPDLAGAGDRWSPAELRERVAHARTLNPASVMPSYAQTHHRRQVGAAWRDRPLLTEAEIDDVVAWLATLRAPRP